VLPGLAGIKWQTTCCPILKGSLKDPKLPRPFKLRGYPVVPLLAIAGMVFVIANSSPALEMTRAISTYTGVVLAVFAVIGAIRVKAVMSKCLFKPVKPYLG
jgi:hypothetical protein